MPRDIVSGSGVRPSNLLAEIFQMILHRSLCATLQDYTLEKAEWLYPMDRVTSGSGRNISPQGVSSPAAYWNPLGSFLKTLMPKNPHGPESLGSCRFWKLPWGFWCAARLNIALTEQKRLAPFKWHHWGDRQVGPCLAACSGCPSQTLVTGQKTIWLKAC